MFLDNKYTKWYYQIISKAKLQNRKKNCEIYYENHHIIPKCKPFCGSNLKDNLVLLTAREHFLVHWLLIKMCSDKDHKEKMYTPLQRMMLNESPQKLHLWSKWQYEIARKANLKFLQLPKSQEHKQKISDSNLGQKRSIETRKKISEIAKGRIGNKNPFYGKQHSDETKAKNSIAHIGKRHTPESKEKISNALKGTNNPFYGKTHTPEQIQKMSDSMKKVLICPHCGKEGRAGGMRRHHFSHCKNLNAIK